MKAQTIPAHSYGNVPSQIKASLSEATAFGLKATKHAESRRVLAYTKMHEIDLQKLLPDADADIAATVKCVSESRCV